MSELEKYVKSNFSVHQSDEIKTIVSLFKFSKIKKGDFLLEPGKRCDVMSFVKSGYLRMFNVANGKEVTQWISSKGTFTTDLSSFFMDMPSRWTIQALTDTELYTISKTDYRKIIDLVPNWSKLEKQLLINCFATMENRIFNYLSMSSLERYDFLLEHDQELFNQIPLKYIASMLGMTAETMSRIRKNKSNGIS